jgi:hypothetical protein
MKQTSTTYITSNNKILLANFRPYGPYGGLGGYIGIHGNNPIDTAINTIHELTGLSVTPAQLVKKGEVIFKDTEVQENTHTHIFIVALNNPQIKKSNELNKLKWISMDKVFNYKLFPNFDRLFMAELLTGTYFKTELTYSQGLVFKKQNS